MRSQEEFETDYISMPVFSWKIIIEMKPSKSIMSQLPGKKNQDMPF
jgi:hypothetical protein